ncbi:MAG: hypothetical protein JST00_25720 [Deltaproteobacteria bacterium]|nr:hypothetical protein [Deltaproteobacteria bacterium]
MMTCREATQLHTTAAEGGLQGTTKLRYDVHMTVCPYCKCYRTQLVTTTSVLAGLPKEKPPEDLLDRLADEIAKKKV